MDIKRSGSQPSSKGPAEYFTGTVRIDPLFQANAPARVAGVSQGGVWGRIFGACCPNQFPRVSV